VDEYTHLDEFFNTLQTKEVWDGIIG